MKRMIPVVDLTSGAISLRPSHTLTLDLPQDFDRTAAIAEFDVQSRMRYLSLEGKRVVLPTQTWQAYNLRDDNGDGKGDTWYANWKVHTARLGRPFLNRGVPYNFRRARCAADSQRPNSESGFFPIRRTTTATSTATGSTWTNPPSMNEKYIATA